MGWWSGSVEMDLEVNLVASTGSGLKAERKFFSQGIKKGIVSGWQFSSAFQSSTKRATDELLKDMMEAIFHLINSYPQLSINEESTESISKNKEPL